MERRVFLRYAVWLAAALTAGCAAPAAPAASPMPTGTASGGAAATSAPTETILTPARPSVTASATATAEVVTTSTAAPTPTPTPALAARATATPSAPMLRYIPGSTTKVEQLLGEEDKQLHQPTLSQTNTRYGIEGTDLGSSFDHQGRAYFLFGDTVGRLKQALDTIATTDVTDPEKGVRLDFLLDGKDYLTIQPPGISMGAFETPAGGISLSGQMYVAVKTNHADDWSTDRSVLTKFSLPAQFQPLRTISQQPAGHFLTLSLHADPEPKGTQGLPAGGPYIFVWGTGHYRQSEAYLSIVPAANFENGQGTRYFAGLNAAGGPNWSANESDAAPLTRNGTLGDLSVTWCQPLGLWLMNADSRPPAPRGIQFAYARTPWGLWSAPQTIFDAMRDGAFGKFIHDPRIKPDDGLAGPVTGQAQSNPDALMGGVYAPYVVERWTRVQGSELSICYTLSTWNPYVVMLMRSRLQVL